MKGDPLSVIDVAHMDADIRPAGLPTPRHSELVPIGWEVSDPADGRRRSVGDDSLVWSSLPRWDTWCQLKPGGAEFQMVWGGCSRQAVDAVRHSLQGGAGCGHSFNGGLGDSRSLQFAAGHESPLFLGDIGDPGKGRRASHHCIIPLVRWVLQI